VSNLICDVSSYCLNLKLRHRKAAIW